MDFKALHEKYKEIDLRTQLFSDFIFPIYMDLIDLCEDGEKRGITDKLKIKTEQYNSNASYNISNMGASNYFANQQMKRFEKYGQCFIVIKPVGNGATFQNTKLGGEFLVGDGNIFSDVLINFCKERGVHIVNDQWQAIIIHTDESIIRDYKLSKIFD